PQWFELCLDELKAEVTSLALAGKRYPFLASISDCCRLIHRGEYPDEDIAVDKYGKWLCVTGFDESLPAKQLRHRLDNVLNALSKLCGCLGGVVKTNLRDPHKRKLFADLATWGRKTPESFIACEHDLHYSVRLNDRQHVGLFLDQRDSRSRIARIAKRKRVANLFAFTCSFSISALAAGAEVVFSVDLASGCLKQGQENVAINQLASAENAKFIKEDVRKWLARQLRKKQKNPAAFTAFDVVICDPPVFASAGKGKSFHVEKEWPGLARDVSKILAKNGIALFSNNHQTGPESLYYNTLTQEFSKVTRLNPPLDFPKVAGQPSHVRIYWCRK
ncbi:MAG: class I SAM-dependent methyltransferase, partial [Thermodesulfobacteriota bacterium]|nr:class I SAM-dependent methyltransferase [Thermodesulfobacteriota bacterium]